MPADHVIPVCPGEVADPQTGQIEHGARLHVHTESAVAVDLDPRGGVNGDCISRRLDGGRDNAGFIRASLETSGAAQGEVLPGDDLRDAVVVQETGDIEQLPVEC